MADSSQLCPSLRIALGHREPYCPGAAHQQGQVDAEKQDPPSMTQIGTTIKVIPDPRLCIITTRFSVATTVKVNFCCPIQRSSLPYGGISQDHSSMNLLHIISYLRICFQKIQSKIPTLEFSKIFGEQRKSEKGTLYKEGFCSNLNMKS